MYEIKIQDQERRIYDLKNLISLGISLSSKLDFESLVESILYSCIGQMFVDRVAILLQTDIDENDMYIHMTKGYDESYSSADIFLGEDSALIKHINSHPSPVTLEELRQIKGLEDDLMKLSSLDPETIVPLKSKNTLNGIILLGRKMTGEPCCDREKEFLSDLSKFAAIAVENSRLYRMATLDRMTRLYIHHYFQDRIEEEIKRAERTRTPLSMIICDIDNFKSVNDTYGHQQGDIILKESAKIIKKLVRNEDIAARYGGEEFAVILPSAPLSAAVEIATRIRRTIEMCEFEGQPKPLHVTISVGVAEFLPSVDRNKTSFIERADTALYKAKRTGKNRVVAHSPKIQA